MFYYLAILNISTLAFFKGCIWGFISLKVADGIWLNVLFFKQCLSLRSGTFEGFQVHGEWVYTTFNGSQTNVLVNELSTGCIAWFNSCFYYILFILFDSSSQLIVIKVTNSWRLCGNSSVSLTLIFILSNAAFIQIRFAYSITKNIKYKKKKQWWHAFPFAFFACWA